MLSQTRPQGFNGPGALRLSDILTLYNAQGWADADIELMQYVRTMLFLDAALRQYYEDRKPSGK